MDQAKIIVSKAYLWVHLLLTQYRKTRKITLTKNNQLISILILQILYFTQIYPFIHFHHIHNDNGFQIAASVHPITNQTQDHTSSHSDEHHHGGEDHYIGDWNYTRPQPKQEVDLPMTFCLGRAFIIPAEPDSFSLVQRFINYSPPQKTFILYDLPRSPPHLS